MTRRTSPRAAIILAFAGWIVLGGSLQAGRAEDLVASRARKVYEQYQSAVVKVTGVAQIRIAAVDRPGLNIPEQTKPFQAAGTLVTKEGLVAVALSAIDPSSVIDGREGNSQLGPVKVNASATIKELEIVLNDGTELPATLVFKDVALDLALIRPKADAPELDGVVFDFIDMTDEGTAQIADEIVSLQKLKDVFQNASSLVRGTVVAVVERPRTCILATNAAQGCPAFSLDGKPLGIGVMRIDAAQGEGSLVLVPAQELQNLIEQVPDADPAGAAVPEAAAPAD